MTKDTMENFQIIERKGPEYRLQCPYCNHVFTILDGDFMDRELTEVKIDCPACNMQGIVKFE